MSSKTKMKLSIPDLFTSSKVDPMLMTSDNMAKAEILGNFFSRVFVKEPPWTWDLNAEDKPPVTEHVSIEITRGYTEEDQQTQQTLNWKGSFSMETWINQCDIQE